MAAAERAVNFVSKSRLRAVRRMGVGVPLVFLVVFLVAGFLAPLPYNPITPNVNAINQPPGAHHWFGTDGLGFDIFSRDIASARYVIPLVTAGTFVSLLIGVPLGLLGSSRSRGAEVLMRLSDAFQAFPLLVLSIVLVSLAGNQLWSVVIAIAIVNVPRFMRLVRSEALVIRETRFVEAARATGCTRLRILLRHVLPNVIGSIVGQASLCAAYGVIVIASLNFLGVGVTEPDPTWGSMIQGGAQTVSQGYWWMIVFPLCTVVLVVVAFNALAAAIGRDA